MSEGDATEVFFRLIDPIPEEIFWLLHVKFSSINTPRDLVKFTLFNYVPFFSNWVGH